MIFLSYFLLITTILHSPMTSKTYNVKHVQDNIQINGKGDHPLWKTATELSDFSYPWETEKAPATSFRAMHSKDWLYLMYDIKDENVNVYEKKHDKTDVLNSDRAEIFFKHDDNLSPYYGLEMDPLGRVYDYKAEFHRKFDPSWSWPAGQLIIKTSRTNDGYIVEVAISKSSLIELGLLKNKMLQAGLFRGECVKLVGSEATLKWISWVKPDSATPDFHIPSSFGVLVLQD